MINTNGYFSGELEIFANAKAFNINILIIECIEEYKGYIKKEKFEIEANTTKPILILEYTKINKLGHFNVVHIKPYENIKDGINHIPLVINNKYNYRILQKINQNDFKYIAENTFKKNLNNLIKINKINYNKFNSNIGDNINMHFEISKNKNLCFQPNLYEINKKYDNYGITILIVSINLKIIFQIMM